MKSAEEVLKSKLTAETMLINSCDYTYYKVLEAMEEYALQFKNNEPTIPVSDSIDTNRLDLYPNTSIAANERTMYRLEEMKALGITEVGLAQFGVEGLMSGLYIEMVWNYSETDWNDYMYWVKELLANK